ncbi:dihydropteroate synthase [Marinilabiliaceae bacterium ANBcel2]|nr:dihydropteroate synthase [Marinilabiliaceae bacterium ANBcel2]
MELAKAEKQFFNKKKYINCRGELINIASPSVMGIINITPDSFYRHSRYNSSNDVIKRVESILEEGGLMVDIGAFSTRPGAKNITPEEETDRVLPILKLLRKTFPELIISVDTFRSDIARKVVEEGADIINDISGGEMDQNMFNVIGELKVPYVLTHIQGTPQTMQQTPYYDDVVADVSLWFAKKIDQLRIKGVSDIIIDPGFGFGKSIEHNYELLHNLDQLALFDLPILVGLSRKSMIYKVLGGSAETSLNGTTVLNTLALTKGASVLRVHDVKEASECIKLVSHSA